MEEGALALHPPLPRPSPATARGETMRITRPARPMLESLESRTLLSAAPAAVAADPAPVDPPPPVCVSAEQLAADRATVMKDMAKLHADASAGQKLLAADR